MKLTRNESSQQQANSIFQKALDFFKGQKRTETTESVTEGKRYIPEGGRFESRPEDGRLADKNIAVSEAAPSVQGLDQAMTMIKIHGAIRQAKTHDSLVQIENFINNNESLDQHNKNVLTEALSRKRDALSMD